MGGGAEGQEERERAVLHAVAVVLSLCGAVLFLPACAGLNEAMQLREQEILAEPLGDYYVGRRYYVKGTRFWGYLRRPREPWEESRLVIFNERVKNQPDRVLEAPLAGLAHGFDHGYEYRIHGHFSGEEVYDPNSNFILPEFVLEGCSLIEEEPGFLFHPDEVYDVGRLPFRQ